MCNAICSQAIHDGMDCKQYQQYMLVDSQDENSKKTKEWMDVSKDKYNFRTHSKSKTNFNNSAKSEGKN